MNKNILVTGALLSQENEQQLRNEGFDVHRLPKQKATEDELIKALSGKSGYILGGVEMVTERVIESVDTLEAIVYNSKNYQVYIPAHDIATKNGIAIANCPSGDTAATAEYALTLMLAMVRNIFDLGRTGRSTMFTSSSLDDLQVGILGLGDIGSHFAHLLKGLVHEISYYSRTRKKNIESELHIRYRSKEDLLSSCNVISIHTPPSSGLILDSEDLSRIPDGGLLVNVSYPEAVDLNALVREVKAGRLRAAFDFPPGNYVKELLAVSPGQFFWSNDYAGYNTTSALRDIGDMATQSITNLLKTGKDRHLVNPEYLHYREIGPKRAIS